MNITDTHCDTACRILNEGVDISASDTEFSLKKQSSEVVVRKAIRCLFKNKRVIFPSSTQHLGIFFERFIPTNATMRFCYNAQNKKG